MTPLSVVIITFNEEKNIGMCIDAAQKVADDIVVVDSFSTDKTKSICQEKGVRFIEHAFAGHIEQKNWAITQAKYPHILSLDADEVLSEQLISSIRTIKQNWDADGYFVNRLNNYCGKWMKHLWYPDQKLRLWDSTKGEWKGKNPHDQFMLEKGCTTKKLKGDLLHYSFHSITQHMEQVRKFSSIKAKADFERGKKSTFLKVLTLPVIKFIRDYFIKMGFLDGYYGWIISKNSAYGKFLHHQELRALWKTKKYS